MYYSRIRNIRQIGILLARACVCVCVYTRKTVRKMQLYRQYIWQTYFLKQLFFTLTCCFVLYTERQCLFRTFKFLRKIHQPNEQILYHLPSIRTTPTFTLDFLHSSSYGKLHQPNKRILNSLPCVRITPTFTLDFLHSSSHGKLHQPSKRILNSLPSLRTTPTFTLNFACRWLCKTA